MELSYRSAFREFKDSLGINMTMKKNFIFVPVQTMKKYIYVRTRTAVEASCDKPVSYTHLTLPTKA